MRTSALSGADACARCTPRAHTLVCICTLLSACADSSANIHSAYMRTRMHMHSLHATTCTCTACTPPPAHARVHTRVLTHPSTPSSRTEAAREFLDDAYVTVLQLSRASSLAVLNASESPPQGSWLVPTSSDSECDVFVSTVTPLDPAAIRVELARLASSKAALLRSRDKVNKAISHNHASKHIIDPCIRPLTHPPTHPPPNTHYHTHAHTHTQATVTVTTAFHHHH